MNNDDLKVKITQLFENSNTADELEKARVEIFGKNGLLNSFKKEIVNIPPQERKDFGLKVNSITQTAENMFSEKKDIIEKKELEEKIKGEKMRVIRTYRERAEEEKQMDEFELMLEEDAMSSEEEAFVRGWEEG